MNNRKQHVLLTAKKLFIENSFDATSIQDILDKSNISKGTFYNYFASKNECLIAILNTGRNETASRRQELIIGKDKTNPTILAEQISIRFQVNHEHNLLPIFEAIFYSSDAELSAFAKKLHYAELSWLSQRLIDVYGKDSKPHATDCAIILLGMIQHMMHIWTTTNFDKKIPTEIVNFGVQQIDSIMPQMIARKQFFFSHSTLGDTGDSSPNTPLTKKQLLNQLLDFNDNLEDINVRGQQYIQFLVEELQVQAPRLHLIESVVTSLREVFTNTSKEMKVQDLTAEIWKYLDSLIQ